MIAHPNPAYKAGPAGCAPGQQPSADSKKSRGKKGSLSPQAAGCRLSATDAARQSHSPITSRFFFFISAFLSWQDCLMETVPDRRTLY